MKKHNFCKLYNSLDEIKVAYLKLEKLGRLVLLEAILIPVNPTLEGNDGVDLDVLEDLIQIVHSEVTRLFPSGNYEDDVNCLNDYIMEKYGTAAWDMIDHPDFVEKMLTKLTQLFSLDKQAITTFNKRCWKLDIHCLKNTHLYFSNLKACNVFIKNNNDFPASAYKWDEKTNNWDENSSFKLQYKTI